MLYGDDQGNSLGVGKNLELLRGLFLVLGIEAKHAMSLTYALFWSYFLFFFRLLSFVLHCTDLERAGVGQSDDARLVERQFGPICQKI